MNILYSGLTQPNALIFIFQKAYDLFCTKHGLSTLEKSVLKMQIAAYRPDTLRDVGYSVSLRRFLLSPSIYTALQTIKYTQEKVRLR